MKLVLITILLFSVLMSPGQVAYKQGDIINDFNAVRILNNATSTSSFNQLKKSITIIDFFGTWCMPCIRALPVLDSLQNSHASIMAVLLVSIEKEAQLNKFIASRNNLNFPVIIDEGNSITNLFQPPAYPYTVVINSANEIVAITEAAEITDIKIDEWLKQSLGQVKKENAITEITPEKKIPTMETSNKNRMTELSAAFIYAAKTGNETSEIERKLQELHFEELRSTLKTDDEKTAFWINIYNGYTQLILRKNPDEYENRSSFFKAKQIAIAGKILSLDEIEHDILRHTKIKWSLGYFNKLFPSKTAKALRVQQLDYRIHFALNCGAKSCSPIAFYDPANLQSQLDVATRAYLNSEASYNATTNELQLPAIMGWFRHDFKGKKSMLVLVKKYNIVPAEKDPSIIFKKYDWNLYLNNYKN